MRVLSVESDRVVIKATLTSSGVPEVSDRTLATVRAWASTHGVFLSGLFGGDFETTWFGFARILTEEECDRIQDEVL